MRKLFLVFMLVTSGLIAQKSKGDFILSEDQKKDIQYKSGSAFMQFSGFVPSSFKEILISVSGNDFVDSLLVNAGTDTLISNGADFFDNYIRKDYALKSVYSSTAHLFSSFGLYDEEAIKCTIVLFYQFYLKKEKINIYKIKKKCLKGLKRLNSKAKRAFKRQIK